MESGFINQSLLRFLNPGGVLNESRYIYITKPGLVTGALISALNQGRAKGSESKVN